MANARREVTNEAVHERLTHWLMMSRWHWAKGETYEDAMVKLKQLAKGQLARKSRIDVYRVSPEVQIDAEGGFQYTYWPISDTDSTPMPYQQRVEIINS